MILALPLDAAFLAAILLAAAGLGRKLLRALKFEFSSPWFYSLIGLGLGFALFAHITFWIGFFGGLSRPVFLVWLGLILIVCWREVGQEIALWRGWPGALRAAASGPFDVFLLGVLAAAIGANLLFAYAPPTQVRELLYDLNFPRMYLEARRIFDLSDRHLAYFPQQIPMLHLLCMTVRGVLLAKLLYYSLGLLSLGVVYLLGGHCFGRRAALYGAAIFYLMPMTASLSGSANVDLGTLFNGLLTVSVFAFWIESDRPRDLLLAAFLAGATAGSKVSGVAAALALFAFAGARLFFVKREPWGKSVKLLALAGAFSALALAPWAFRNFWFTGNPMMPYAVPVLHLPGHEAAEMEIRYCKKLGDALTLKDKLKGYHNLFFGDFIYGAGPLAFAFLLPAFYRPEKKKVWLLFGFALANYAFLNGLLLYPHRFYETRYFCVSYALWCMLSGAGLEAASGFLNDKLLKGLTALCLLFPCLMFSLKTGLSRLPVFLGRQSPEAYVESKLPQWPLVQLGNRFVPANGKVLSLGGGEAHFYYWKARIVDPPLSLLKEREPERVLEYLRRNGFTHVLFFEKILRPDPQAGIFRHADIGELDLHWDWGRMAGTSLLELGRSGPTVLYEVRYP